MPLELADFETDSGLAISVGGRSILLPRSIWIHQVQGGAMNVRRFVLTFTGMLVRHDEGGGSVKSNYGVLVVY